ncbi:MAG: hypothetical protein V1901_03780 [Patescibacteria group bacterium]
MANPFNISIVSKGKNPIEFIREVKGSMSAKISKRLVDLANQTLDEMREIIKTSKKRPSTGETLENSIINEILNYGDQGISIGIGRISLLPKYWKVLNDGGYVPPVNIGYFGNNFRAPEPGGAGEQWNHTGKDSGFFRMTPAKAIEGIDYIGISARHLLQKLETELKDWIYQEIDRLARS